MPRPRVVLVLLLAASAASLMAALVAGTFPVSLRQVIDSVLYPTPGVVHDVIWRLRAPRAGAAFLIGSLASASGALWHELIAERVARRGRTPRSSGAAAGIAATLLLAGAGVACARLLALGPGPAALVLGASAASGALGRYGLRRVAITGRIRVPVLAALAGGSLLTLADTLARL